MTESPKLMYWIYRFVGIPDPKNVKVVMIASWVGVDPTHVSFQGHYPELTTLPQSSCLWRILWLDEFLLIISKGQWFNIWHSLHIHYWSKRLKHLMIWWNGTSSVTHTQRKIYWLPFTAFSTWKFCSKLKSRFKDANACFWSGKA